MGISSAYWAGFCVNLQILCENLAIAAGAQDMGGTEVTPLPWVTGLGTKPQSSQP